MKIRIRLVGGVMLTAISVMLFGSCVSDKDSSGLEYMPDMYRSPAIEPYVDYGEIRGRRDADVKMQQSALTPPMGTIPYYGTNKEEIALMLPFGIKPNILMKATHGLVGYEFTTEDTYKTQAAAWTTNPLTLTEDNADAIFAEGKKLFIANCVHCHGAKGDGKGPMMTNQTFTGVPDYANIKDTTNGQMFYSIYYGKGAMGSHASILNKKEIWTLVHYVRKFQDPAYGTIFNAASEILEPEPLPIQGAIPVADAHDGHDHHAHTN